MIVTDCAFTGQRAEARAGQCTPCLHVLHVYTPPPPNIVPNCNECDQSYMLGWDNQNDYPGAELEARV